MLKRFSKFEGALQSISKNGVAVHPCTPANAPSATQILRFYFNFSAMLSDVPHDSEADIVSEPYDNINDCEEEPDFVPIGKSNFLVKISPLDGNHLV